MEIKLRPVRLGEPKAVYDLFQSIPPEENGFKNSAAGLSETEFAGWIERRIDNANGIGLEDGRVPDTCFILFAGGVPSGMSKLRHRLTPALERRGGHIGYAIAPTKRGMGLGNIIIGETLKRARAMGMGRILITAHETDEPSWRAIEKNGGVLKDNLLDLENGISCRRYWIELAPLRKER